MDFIIADRVAGGFGLRLRGYRRFGKGIVVETDEGLKKIFPLRHPPEEYRFACRAADFLRRQGFSRLPRHVSTPGGDPVVRVGGEYYAMREWIPGTAADLDYPCHLSQAVEMLAWFHRSGRGFRAEAAPSARDDWGSWPRRLASCIDGFYYCEGLARGGEEGDRFDRLFLQYFDEILVEAARARDELAASPYDEIIAAERELGGICHRDYHGRYLVFSKEGVLFLTEFENLAMESRLEDLGIFLLHHGDWDPERILFILRVYREVAPLSRAEVDCLLAYLRFPFSCWEAVDAHYRGGSSGRSDLLRAVQDLPHRAEVLDQLRRADLSFLDGVAPIHGSDIPLPREGLPGVAPRAEPEGIGEGGPHVDAPAESLESSAVPATSELPSFQKVEAEPQGPLPQETVTPLILSAHETGPSIPSEGEASPVSGAEEVHQDKPGPSGPAAPMVWRPFPAPIRRARGGRT